MARFEERTYYQDSRARIELQPGIRPEDLPEGLTGKTQLEFGDPSKTLFRRDPNDVKTLKEYNNTSSNAFDKTAELRTSILALDVTRRLGAPGGGWSVTLKSDQLSFDFLDFIRPNDWVDIYFGDGKGERLEMVGLVDRVQESTQATSNGSTTRTYTLSGREAIGKVLTTTEIFYDIRAKPELALADFSKRVIQIEDGVRLEGIRAVDMVPTIMREFGGTDGQFIHPLTGLPFLGPNSNMVDLTTHVGRRNTLSGVDAQRANDTLAEQNIEIVNSDGSSFQYKTGDVVNNDELLTRYVIPNKLPSVNGKLWNSVQKWIDPSFHTLYFDVLPGEDGLFRTSLVFKQHPYDIDVFFALPDHDVFSTEVVSSNLGRTDAEVFNWVKILTKMIPQGRGEAATIYAEPFLSKESFNAHGVHRWYNYTVYPFKNPRRSTASFGPESAKEREGGFIGLLRSLTDVFSRWHSFNDLMVNGTIQLGRLRTDIRLGDRINYFRRGDEGFSFLVEGVRHQYVFKGTSTTTLNVTRGIPLFTSSQYLDFVAAAQQRVEKMGADRVRAVDAVNFRNTNAVESRVLPSEET